MKFTFEDTRTLVITWRGNEGLYTATQLLNGKDWDITYKSDLRSASYRLTETVDLEALLDVVKANRESLVLGVSHGG